MDNSLLAVRGINHKYIVVDGIFGVVVGDALGCPVEFKNRDVRKADPVVDMREYGTFDLPRGSWTDDSSMALAELDSIGRLGCINLNDMMESFTRWYRNGDYTPFGRAFDIGNICQRAISRYQRSKDPYSCGGVAEYDNGNGSLMRIMPACIYAYEKSMSIRDAINMIHEVSGLTHNHNRAKIACGLYYFLASAILKENGPLLERLQKGMDEGFLYYGHLDDYAEELKTYSRIRTVDIFSLTPEEDIRSGGYVVDSLEASVWCLARTDNYKDCTLLAVNLGDDTDTTAAIVGGLAGLYYGIDSIPKEWIDCIQKKEWIEDLCERASNNK